MFQYIIDRLLNERNKYDPLIQEATKYSLDIFKYSDILPYVQDFLTRGKKIRSVMFFKIIKNRTITKDLLKAIGIIEVMHSASLFHDDVVDNNSMRRNSSSFMGVHGKKRSILFADYIFNKSINEFLKLNISDLSKRQFLKELSSISYGASLETLLSTDSSVQDCLRVNYLKTASMFKLVSFIGSYESGHDFEEVKQASLSGISFGMIFQIQNDLNSYVHERYKDSEDFVQRNITVPIVISNCQKQLSDQSQMSYDSIRLELKSNDFESSLKKRLNIYLKRFEKC